MTDNPRLVLLREVQKERPWATVRFLRRLIYDRRLSYFKVGGKVLVSLDDLDAFAAAGRVEAQGQGD